MSEVKFLGGDIANGVAHFAIKPKPFAKLFEHAELGQILVRRGRDDDDEKPGVRITFDPAVDVLAPCDFFLGVGGIDEDAAERAADQLFANMTEEIAVQIVGQQAVNIRAQFGGPDANGASTAV